MGKVFTYAIPTSAEQYSEETDETFCDVDDYEYEVEYSRLEDATLNLIFQKYFSKCKLDELQKSKVKDSIKDFISDFDLYDQLEEGLEDELKDYFENEAIDSLSD